MTKTNRDLYQEIHALAEEHSIENVGLERYLLALLALAHGKPTEADFDCDEFVGLLGAAFKAEPAAFDETWRQATYDETERASGYDAWHNEIITQIVDLREMAEAGTLDDEWKSFGTQSPRGRDWYNFSPEGYLECAVSGCFGGWVPTEEWALQVGPAGMREVPASEVELEPAVVIERIDWDTFAGFLVAGRVYE